MEGAGNITFWTPTKIEDWRQKQALQRTEERRPDLLDKKD